MDIQHADGMLTRYAHMADFAAGIAGGTPVSVGQVIGHIGISSRARGAHVHFEARLDGRAVDPKPYLGLAACSGTPDSAPVESPAASEQDRR